MKKRILVLTAGFLFIGINLFAANGDLYVTGNVGVGTTAPQQALEVQTSSGWSGIGIITTANNDNGATVKVYKSRNAGPAAINDWSGGIEYNIYNSIGNRQNIGAIHGRAPNVTAGSETGEIHFYTRNGANWNDNMVITSSGNVGIGATIAYGYKLYVNGSGYVNGPMYATSFNPISDKRWKKNITPIKNSLSLIEKLQGVRFDWKIEEFKDKNFEKGRQMGLIAQDVEPVIPEIVKTDKDGYKAISYEKLTAVLVEAVKEQNQKIKELEAKINKMKKETKN